jgi:transcriptional regulator with XRE-family HTH domain
METANFGTVLREARERRQVSLADVSRRTKVSVASLQLLEQGKLADLPHETFVRGFIRSYAQTVGISHVESLSLFDDAVAARRNAEALPRLVPAPACARGPGPAAARTQWRRRCASATTWDWPGGLRDHRPAHRDYNPLSVPASAATIGRGPEFRIGRGRSPARRQTLTARAVDDPGGMVA